MYATSGVNTRRRLHVEANAKAPATHKALFVIHRIELDDMVHFPFALQLLYGSTCGNNW